jgi:hypothetical protein
MISSRTDWMLITWRCKLDQLTLVQVGDCWKYALEAINKYVYYHISPFMIIVYYSCYNCINRKLYTCVNMNKHNVPSMPLLD